MSNRQTVFFLPVDPLNKEHKYPETVDLKAPRLAKYMHKAWKKHQNTLYWVDINLAQKKGLKFYQTRSNAIILHETLLAYCIPKVVWMETGEVIYEKAYASPRAPPKISLKHDLMKELGSEVARHPKGEVARLAEGSQPIQPNPNHDRTVRPVVSGQPTGLFTQLEEVDIDFRISGLPHSVMKQAKNSRVRELVKKIENDRHRQDLQADLQQNNACNPFSEKSKKMIKDMGNVELFELCETDPKVQCKGCLLYWNQGIVYCTCGHLLSVNPADVSSDGHWIFSQSRTMSLRRDDLMAIDMGRLKNKETIFFAHNLRKRCIKRKFEGIHDRLLKDPVFREAQLEHDRTEEVCIQMDKDAQKDFTYRLTQEEYFRLRKNWWISFNKSGEIGLVRDRSEFNDALTTLNRPNDKLTSAILEIPGMALIIEFFLRLVAMERFLVELMIINKKVHN